MSKLTSTSTLLAAAALAFAAEPIRFDHVVRNDFFAGLIGNQEALARGMKTTEAILVSEPNHAEALVWHGVGLFMQSGQAFQRGDRAQGMEMYGKSMAEMDRAVALEPKNIGVRIPRGATLMAAARMMSGNPMVPSLRQRALEDYLQAYDLQKDSLASLGTHPRGELLFGIADTYAHLGDAEKADRFFALLAEKLAGTPYEKRAAAWRETKQPLPAAQAACIGCHVQ